MHLDAKKNTLDNVKKNYVLNVRNRSMWIKCRNSCVREFKRQRIFIFISSWKEEHGG